MNRLTQAFATQPLRSMAVSIHPMQGNQSDMAGSPTILLIEDDREIQSTIRTVLESAGYGVLVAPNGKDGKRLIEKESPALVITDMMMPQMGGFPVLEYLQSLESPPAVIMITANEGGRHKAYAEMLGVHDYLRKPFAMDVLLDAVEKAIGAGGSQDGRSRLTRKKADDQNDDS